MDNNNAPVYVFNTHAQAEDAIPSLGKTGFDVKQLSLMVHGSAEELLFGSPHDQWQRNSAHAPDDGARLPH